jgi:hypothetical protein
VLYYVLAVNLYASSQAGLNEVLVDPFLAVLLGADGLL